MDGSAVPYPASPPAERREAWPAAELAYCRVMMQREGDDWCGRPEAIDAYPGSEHRTDSDSR